jgi:hypothetical protein
VQLAETPVPDSISDDQVFTLLTDVSRRISAGKRAGPPCPQAGIKSASGIATSSPVRPAASSPYPWCSSTENNEIRRHHEHGKMLFRSARSSMLGTPNHQMRPPPPFSPMLRTLKQRDVGYRGPARSGLDTVQDARGERAEDERVGAFL